MSTGRQDHQVKLRGYRIEMGEIEACLEQFAGTQQAVVLLREDRPGDQRLVAYLHATEDTTQPDEHLLRAWLQQRPPA